MVWEERRRKASPIPIYGTKPTTSALQRFRLLSEFCRYSTATGLSLSVLTRCSRLSFYEFTT